MTGELAVVTGTVADHLIVSPYRLPAGATVADALDFFEGDHVHAALVLDGQILLAVLVRSDLEGADPEGSAASRGRLHGRTVDPGDDAELVRREMLDAGVRRLAAVDDDGRLLGLLCLKRSGLGFCSDADVRSRRDEHSIIGA